MDLRAVEGHRGADRPAAQACRQGDPALDRQQRGAARTGDRVLVDLPGGRHVGRQGQRGIPERARPQHGVGSLLGNLPVEPAQGLEEPRLGRRHADVERAIRRPGEAAHELVEVRAELGRHAPLHMPLEQQQQAEAGDRQSEDDGGRASRKKAQPERALPHVGAGSGTR